jgi:glycerophosphoryl diester phosphodiesterase
VFDSLPRPLLFAHRGASAYAPENTLEAFDLALRQGATVLELDVRCTRDREIVVFHDATLDRTTDGSGAVCERDWQQIAALDAGFHFQRHGQHLFRGRGLRVPRLAEVVGAFPDAGLNIELKDPGMARAVLDIIADHPRVVVAAAEDTIMAELEAEDPACPLGLSTGQAREVILGSYWGGVPRAYRGRALQIPLRHPRFLLGLLPVATARVIRAARDAGIETHLWVINDVGVAEHWLARGADGIVTDDPGALAALESFGPRS